MSLLWYDEVINVIQVHLLNLNCATRIWFSLSIIICLSDLPYSSLYSCTSFISNLVNHILREKIRLVFQENCSFIEKAAVDFFQFLKKFEKLKIFEKIWQNCTRKNFRIIFWCMKIQNFIVPSNVVFSQKSCE